MWPARIASRTSRAWLFMVRQSIVPKRVRGAWPRKMFSATVSSSNSTVSWWMAVMPWAKAACALGSATGCPSIEIVPASGW